MTCSRNICICGIGYVGLTLAAVMAEQGFSVFGAEIKREVVEGLNQGRPHFHENGLAELVQRHLGTRLRFGTEIPKESFEAYIISVGTPLNPRTKEPDLKYLIHAAEDLSHYVSEDSLVILRSTVPVGVTRDVVLPILQHQCPNVRIAFCPERTVEGRALMELKSLPQIIGGLDYESIMKAADIFRSITPNIVPVSSLETAEMIKLLDNSYRDLNFAFANLTAVICELFGVDAMEAIHCANLGYSRNRIPVPGFVGGACLEKDPHILVHSSKTRGYEADLIRDGRMIHEGLPARVVDRVCRLLQDHGKNPAQSRVFLTGLAFKGQPETDDLRGSLSLEIVQRLKEAGFPTVFVHDFIVPYPSVGSWGVSPVTITEGFRGADAVIIGNNHLHYRKLPIADLLATANHPVIFYDSWRIFDRENMLMMPGVHYEGLGLRNPVRR